MAARIDRDTFRSYLALAHAEASSALGRMMEGITVAADFPSIQDGSMRGAIKHLEAAAQTLREALARLDDPKEGGGDG